MNQENCIQTGNYKGSCCCNCIHQKEVLCHPDNEEIGRGNISRLLGWGCSTPMDGMENKIIFSEGKHGFCEMHNPNQL